MTMTEPQACIFCRIVQGELPARQACSGPLSVAFHDLDPVADLHVLVVPRQHVVDALELGPEHGDLLVEMFTAARTIAREHGLDSRGYRLVFNVGPDAGAQVPHLHMHVLGGRPLAWPPG